MITRDRLLGRIRRLLGDEQMVACSDYELTSAVNDGLDYLSRHLALLGSDLTESTAALTDGDRLPADLVTLRSVMSADGRELTPLRIGMPVCRGGYRIESGTIRTAEPCTITYQRTLPLLGDEGTLDLPDALTDTIAKTAVLVLGGADEAARAKALAGDSLILTRRQRTRRRSPLPWRI